jgi:hypothetical protein
MADASENAVEVAWVLVVVTGLEIVGLSFVVFLAYKANKESRKAAEAATEANTLTRHALQTNSRAWVSLHRMEPPQQVQDPDKKIKGYVFVLWLKNSGITPALDTQTWSDFKLLPKGESIEAHTFEPSKPRRPGVPVGGDGTPFSGPIIRLEMKDLVAIAKKDVSAYFWVRCEYLDIFGDGHTTEFVSELACMSHPDVVLGKIKESLRFQLGMISHHQNRTT